MRAHFPEQRLVIEPKAMRASGIIVLAKSNWLVKNIENKKILAS